MLQLSHQIDVQFYFVSFKNTDVFWLPEYTAFR